VWVGRRGGRRELGGAGQKAGKRVPSPEITTWREDESPLLVVVARSKSAGSAASSTKAISEASRRWKSVDRSAAGPKS
jgi:hypothetical protein